MIINLSLFKLIYNLNRFAVFSHGLSLFLGEYLIYIFGIGILLYLILSKESKKEKTKWLFILILACCLSNVIVTPLIHYICKSARPFLLMPAVGTYAHFLKVREYNTSFPSGHTSLAFAVAVVVFLKNKKWGKAALIIATLVSVGRILMGVHWPMDILGGLSVGILCALVAYELAEKLLTKTAPIK